MYRWNLFRLVRTGLATWKTPSNSSNIHWLHFSPNYLEPQLWNPKPWNSLLLLHQERKLINLELSPRVIAALSGFIHKEAAAPAENVRECEGTKLSKYKWRSQNTSRAVALPFFIYCTNISGRQRQSCLMQGAPLTCSHSTLAKQNGVRDKQQIGNFSWLEWQWDPNPVGVTRWPVLPIAKVEELWEWRALPDLWEVTGWVTLTDGSDLPPHCVCWVHFFFLATVTDEACLHWLAVAWRGSIN